jgi:hypothetical protein
VTRCCEAIANEALIEAIKLNDIATTATDVLSIFVAFLLVLEGAAIFSWVAFVARFVLHDALLSEQQLGYIMLCYICPYVAWTTLYCC